MAFKTYTPSKADQAREVVKQLQAAGHPVRPKTVLVELAKRGVIMDPAQCARLTAAHRTGPRRTYNWPGARKKPRAANKPATVGQLEQRMRFTDYAGILLAVEFAKSCGGIEKARKTLDTLAKVVAPVAR